MKISEIIEAIGPFILVAMIAYSFYLFYRIRKSNSLNKENQGQNRSLYIRLLISAIIGFLVFFSATWLRLKQLGAGRWGWNPYAGPPPMMTCLFLGSFGITIGALVGLITRKKQTKDNE